MEKCEHRGLDKFKDTKLCDMTIEERDDFFQAIAQRGAVEALKAIGMNDPEAASDLKDVRAMLKGYRVMKNAAWTTTLTAAGKVLTWIVILGIAGLFLHTTVGKHLATVIAE